MDAFVRDLRLAVRLLHRRAGFSVLAASVLALAIGANSAIFSVVEGVLLRDPAYRDPGRLVLVWERNTPRSRDRNVVGPYNFVRWNLLGAFAAVALLMAAVGVYGVMSYSVMERIPEVGVRLAVGASPGDIVRLVLRDGLSLGLAGIVVGLVGAIAAAGVLNDLLFEIAPRDPLSLAAVALLLLLATVAAASLPARRAARVDPIEALRSE